MENASKALIIAGAILLAILIISLGIMIYNQASGTVNNNAIDEVDITSFNQKFTQYEGDNIRGAQVKSLIQEVNSNNGNENNEEKQVTLNGATFPKTSQIENNKTYNVVMAYGSDGRINVITVYEGKNNTTTQATVS